MSTVAVARRRTKAKKSKRMQVADYAGDAYSLAKRTAQGLNYLRKLINIETKYFDVLPANFTVNSTGVVTPLNLIPQGLNISDRVGDSIKIQHIRYRLVITSDPTAIVTTVRFLIVRDLENAGATPSTTDILESANVVAQPNFINTRTRFSILVDEHIALDIDGISASVHAASMAHAGHIRFRGTAGAAASQAQGALFFLVLSSQAALLLPTITFASRLEYTDD